MAGIFGFFDFTKPGKGIDADAPEKRALFRFLEILWLRKGKLIVINMLYFLCTLPVLLAFHLFFFEPMLDKLAPISGDGFTGSFIVLVFSFIFSMPELLLIVLLVASAFVMGPLTCGFTYMLRNFVRREHAWMSDLWQRAKMNFKQGIFLGILDAVMFYIGFFNLSLLFDGSDSQVPVFVTVGAVVVFFIYLCMRNTLYLMAVTVELSNFNLIRNALILAFAGIWRHFLTGIISGAFIVLILLINSFVELVVMPFIGYSLLGMVSVFISYPLVDKYLLQPQLNKEEDVSA